MTSENKTKITALVVTVVFLAAIGLLIYNVNVNGGLKKDLTAEKLKNEKLLSEKLNLDKQIKNFKDNIASLEGKNFKIDKLLSQANEKMVQSELTINKLNRDKASLAFYKKESAALALLKEDLLKQVAELSKTNKELNGELSDKDRMLANLQKENQELMSKNNTLVREKLFADNFRIESLKKKNEKLTVKASRTKNVVVSFDVPEKDAGKVSANIFRLEVKKPIGVQVQGEQKITFFDVEDNLLTASAGNEPYIAQNAKRATIAFKPTEKLQKGIYTVSIYDGEELVGNSQIRLMK